MKRFAPITFCLHLILATGSAHALEIIDAVQWGADESVSTRVSGIEITPGGEALVVGTHSGLQYTPWLGVADYGIDGFLRKYTPDLTMQWERAFVPGGVDESLVVDAPDRGRAVTADLDGNIYTTGIVSSVPVEPGEVLRGDDVFLSKYSQAGAPLWQEFYGASDSRFSRNRDEPRAVGVSSDGSVYLAGETNRGSVAPIEAFLNKYNVDGELQWSNVLEDARGVNGWDLGVNGDGSAVFAYRTSEGTFLGKYGASGELLWTKKLPHHQFGENLLSGRTTISLDANGNTLVLSWIAGVYDRSYVAKYSSGGDLVWLTDGLSGRMRDITPSGSLAVVGGSTQDGNVYVGLFDSTGAFLRATDFGTPEGQSLTDITADEFGNVYVAGSTSGNLFAQKTGERDAFLVRLQVPEPASHLLILISAAALIPHRRLSLPHA